MDKLTVSWYVNKEFRHTTDISSYKGKTVFPAASHIQNPDTLTIYCNLPVPSFVK